MKKIAYWLLAASPAFVALPTSAAIHNVSNSDDLRSALSLAAASPEDDTIILSSGTTFQTINGFPFAYNSTIGGNLTIESETGAVLDGGGTTEVLDLNHSFSPATYGDEDSTLFTLKNLTIRNGLGSNEMRRGAGLTVKGASTIIQDSHLIGNEGRGNASGAAIFFAGPRNYTLTISNTEISDNVADNGYSETSVVQVLGAKELVITDNSKLLRNKGQWGVVFIKSAPTIISNNTLFDSNTSNSFGVINPDSSPVKIQSSQFKNNKLLGTTGAGVLSAGNYQIEDSLFEGNSASGFAVLRLNRTEGQFIKNSRFINNTSENQGIMSLGEVSGSSAITNSLFQGNTTATARGAVFCASTCQIVNSMFVDNLGGAAIFTSRTSPEDTIIANTVFIGSNPVVNFKDGRSRVTMNNNFIDPAAPVINPTQLLTLNGNITDDPAHGLDLNNDFMPSSSSILIDAGTSDPALAALPTEDLIGNVRVAGDNVDIGWIEYGSSNTVPVITSFEFLSSGASNLDAVEFRLEYQLADENSIATIALKTDKSQIFDTVELDQDIFKSIFMEGGAHTATVKVTNPAGEYATRDLSFQLSKLDTLGVMQWCSQNLQGCGIDATSIREEGYKSGLEDGRAESIASCKATPEDCGIDTDKYVAEGKEFCKDNPQACDIEVSTGAFDTSLIPSMSEDWELFGTGQNINNLAAVFSSTSIVWARINGEWQAYSQNTQTKNLLEQNNIPQLHTIPANHGFWVKK